MRGLHTEMGLSGYVMGISLEILFLVLCIILIGSGMSELKKGKSKTKNSSLVFLGFALAAVSLWMAKLFLEG